MPPLSFCHSAARACERRMHCPTRGRCGNRLELQYLDRNRRADGLAIHRPPAARPARAGL